MAAQETGFLWSAEILKSRARSVDYIELYERYCKEHKLENIIHDCVCEIKKARENCVICDIEQLENYEKVKGKLFIRLLNADKNRDVLKDTIHHKVGDIALVLYYMAGEKDGYILSTKVKKHFL